MVLLVVNDPRLDKGVYQYHNYVNVNCHAKIVIGHIGINISIY